MGCDIHWVLEVKDKDKWVGLMHSSYNRFPAGDRWYAFFTELGLEHRGESDTAYKLHGYPEDMSDLTKYVKDTGCWDHSESHLSLEEFTAAYKRAHEKYPCSTSEEKLKELFGDSFEFLKSDSARYRVVFAFDN